MRPTLTLLLAMTMTPASADDWRTDAEKSGFVSTPPYEQTMAWLRRLDAATEHVHVTDFGTSPEGRALPLAIAARGGEFTPEAARKAGKLVVLVEGGIHAGEIEGKDAGLALLRDLTVAGKYPKLLEHAVLLYVPIFNVDGHERSGPYNRINQNGPAEMGWRGTSQRINLNRDFLKADAPEMRAWLALWNRWSPDLFVDVHTTDGADYAYDLTWYLEEWANQHEAVRAWQQRALVGRVFPATGKRGHRLAPYLDPVDHRDVTKGFANFGSGPRFSTGYTAIRNRPGILLETHMLKTYAVRVQVTYDFLLSLLEEIDRHPQALRDAVARADADVAARASRPGAKVPVALAATSKPETFELEGYAFTQTPSDISDSTWTRYDTAQPKTWQVPFLRDLEVVAEATPPAAYAIPAQWTEAIARVRAHGLRHSVIAGPATIAAEAWRLSNPKFAPASFEGRVMITAVDQAAERVDVVLPAGSVVVPLDQPGANVAVQLFEPNAPDSLLRWGFFNIVFEQRESADARVAEQVARDLLAADPGLQAQFDEALKDPAFAANPAARLNWFVQRSNWRERDLGLLPIYRLDAEALRKLAL